MTVQSGAQLPVLVRQVFGSGWKGSGVSGLAGARCWVLRDQASCRPREWWWGLGRRRDPHGSSMGHMKLAVTAGGVWCRSYVENYTVDASILDRSQQGLPFGWSCCRVDRNFNLCGQVSKSKRWMPWHLEPKKDVEICDKPRGADNRAVSRGFPNGETPPGDLSTW